MNTTANLRFDKAKIMFKDRKTHVLMSSREADTYAFGVTVDCWHLDWQVSSMAQISNALSQVFSAVEHLTLRHEVQSQSSEEHNDVGRIEWRNLLRSFNNVKTLRVADRLFEELSRLGLEDGEPPLELLPDLRELTYSGSRDTGDVFTSFNSFIGAPQNAGRPVKLVLHNPEARYLIRDSLQVYRLKYIFRVEHYDMGVPNATKFMPSGKASRDISERLIIPIYVSFASSNGFAATSTGIISGRNIQVSTPT